MQEGKENENTSTAKRKNRIGKGKRKEQNEGMKVPLRPLNFHLTAGAKWRGVIGRGDGSGIRAFPLTIALLFLLYLLSMLT